MFDVLDAQAVRRWSRLALEGLAAAREEIDALNVYPVPDRDTGTNLYLTLESAAHAVGRLAPDADLRATCAALAHGALLGARGNSGVILSQLLRGVAGTLADPAGLAHPPALGEALTRAVDLAYSAVARPVEGTMLTVARAAADAAQDVADDSGLAAAAQAAARAAHRALLETTEQLAPLQAARVVDAGGRGITVVLDALVAAVTGAAPVAAERPAPAAATAAPSAVAPTGPEYEVMYLLDAEPAAIEPLREALASLGESVAVVGGDGLWNVHAHVDDVGAAVEAGVRAGRPHGIRVTAVHEGRHAAGSARPGRVVVATASGTGLATLLHGAGAVVADTTAEDLLAQVRAAGAGEVVLLPDSRSALAAAETAAASARRHGMRTAVVPSVTPVQALAALAVHEPLSPFEDAVVQMTAASGATRHGAVVRAEPAGGVGLVAGEVTGTGDTLAEAARMVLRRLLAGGGELVTLVAGQDAPAGLTAEVVAWLGTERPEVTAVVYDGGQPGFPLLVGVE